jgi:hypothetical protein
MGRKPKSSDIPSIILVNLEGTTKEFSVLRIYKRHIQGKLTRFADLLGLESEGMYQPQKAIDLRWHYDFSIDSEQYKGTCTIPSLKELYDATDGVISGDCEIRARGVRYTTSTLDHRYAYTVCPKGGISMGWPNYAETDVFPFITVKL